MVCPKCQSENVIVQQVQTGSIGTTSYHGNKKHSLMWWCFIGWWYKMFHFICIGWWSWIFFRKKDKLGSSISASKTFNKTMATCQNCGNSWKI